MQFSKQFTNCVQNVLFPYNWTTHLYPLSYIYRNYKPHLTISLENILIKKFPLSSCKATNQSRRPVHFDNQLH